MTSFDDIANFMDPVVPPRSLVALAAMHRWPGGESPTVISFRDICERHRDRTRHLKTLFYNTWLLPGVTLETYCQAIKKRLKTELARIAEKPIRQVRAQEIAESLVANEYDIVALAEVFDLEIINLITNIVSEDVDQLSQELGPEPDGVISSVSVGAEVLGLLPIPGLLEILGASCPPFFSRRIGAEPINSGLMTLGINRTLSNPMSMIYENRGNPLKDADYWSSKGVLRVEIPTSVGIIELYSTHNHAGGGLDVTGSPSVEDRNTVRRSQYQALREFIEESRDPRNICVVVGDFNRNGMDLSDDPEYQFLISEMGHVGLEDLWVSRARDEFNKPNPQPTVLRRNNPLGWYREEVCRLDGSYCDDLAVPETFETEQRPGRIDYIFVEQQTAEHSFILDVTRPRRVPFSKDPITEGIEHLSDHVGLELTLIASAL